MAKANLDKVNAKKHGNIETVVATVDLPNGSLVALGDMITGEREAFHAEAPDNAKELLLVVAPEVKFDESLDQLDYTTKAGEAVRAYHLAEGDLFQVEQTLFAVAPKKGDVVTGGAAHKYIANVSGRTTFKVEQLPTFGYDRRPMALLRVLTV